MNILLAVHHRLERNAGAAGATLALADEFRSAGHNVDLFCIDDVRLPVGDRYRQAAFPSAFAVWMARHARHATYDVVDASTGDVWIWQLLRGSRRSLPVVVTRSHGLEHISARERSEEERRGKLKLSRRWHIYDGRIRLWEVRRSLRASTRALFLNSTDRAFAIERLGVSPQRTAVIPNGLDRALVGLPLPEPVDGIRIAQIGSHLPMKGVAYAAEALNNVLARHPQVSVTLLGTGVDDKLALSGLAPDLRSRVTIHARFERTDLPQLLAGHEILLFPTLSEGFGIALLEGMACGLAPVATRTAGPREIVTDGESGLLVPTRDVAALETALERLITDGELRLRIRAAAHARAQSFDWPSVARRVLGVYAEALDEGTDSSGTSQDVGFNACRTRAHAFIRARPRFVDIVVPLSQADLIRRSVKAYGRNHERYEKQHGEIFNEPEQERLGAELRRAIAHVESADGDVLALDIGCGTGNMTRHLVDIGANVIAADVSPHFLATVARRYRKSGKVRTALLNGADLDQFDSNSMDFVAAYSVLHHVPDYLGLVAEIVRILKPGGVVYLDHEVNHNYWNPPADLKRFRAEVTEATRNDRLWNPEARRWQRYLEPSRYLFRLRRAISPRYQIEGDIHVWQDDHIEWPRIEQRLIDEGAEVLRRQDYLVFREGCPPEIHRRYAAHCTDMMLIAARKRSQMLFSS